jgi:hypothetical protein
MRKLLLPLLLLAITAISFQTVKLPLRPAVPLCEGLNSVIKEEPTGFAMLKGELNSEEEGSKSYESKITFDGWPNNEFVLDDDGSSSVDIQSDLMTKAKAAELFNQTSKQITSCLNVKGSPLKIENIDQMLIFTKGKVEIALMQITTKGKTLVLMSISRA